MFPSMQKFQYERPANLAEALSIIAGLKAASLKFAILGGGTDLVSLLKEHDLNLDAVVSLSGIEEIKGVRQDEDKALVIGGGTSLSDLIADAGMRGHIPALAEAAERAAGPQIRARATVAGNLLVGNRCPYYNQNQTVRRAHGLCHKDGGGVCHIVPKRAAGAPLCQARFVSDLAPAFLVLGAALKLVGPDGSREVQLKNFYIPDGIARNKLNPDEILAEIRVPLPPPRAMRYEKLKVRDGVDFPSVGAAVAISKGSGGDRLSVAVTGVGSAPLLMEFDAGGFPTRDDLIAHAAKEAMEASVALRQDFFPPSYRKRMIAVLIRRAAPSLDG